MRPIALALLVPLTALVACVVDDGARVRRTADLRPSPRELADPPPEGSGVLSAVVGDADASTPVDAGDASDASACGARASAAACHVCCLDANPAAVAVERAAFVSCACEETPDRGACRARCGAAYCAGGAPPSADCLACLDGVRATCDAVVAAACGNSSACAALDACVAQAGCNGKP